MMHPAVRVTDGKWLHDRADELNTRMAGFFHH